MLKKRLQFSRTAALIVVLCMGTSGAYALISSRAASAPSGAIKITTYAWDGQPVAIGNVRVVVETVGGSQRCDSNDGVTNAAGDNSVTLTDCKVANNGSQKMYRLVDAQREGYSFRSLHMNNGDMAIGDNNSFPVRKGVTTSLSVYMNPPPTFNPPPAAPDPTPATKHKGSVKITSYAFVSESSQVGIGNVKMTVTAVDGPEKCTANTGTTNAAGDNSVTLEGCEVADSGGPKTYEIKAERDGYTQRSVRIVEGTNKTAADNNRFTIKKDEITNLHVWMTPPPNFEPPAVGGTGGPGGGAGGGAGAKNGHLEVTSYTYESDSKQTRQANVKVKVNSIGSNGDKAQTCDDTERTTDANGGSSQANANYAQANFLNCWTGPDGKRQYQLSAVEAPSGYAFRSLHVISGGTFVSGGKSSQRVDEPFLLTAEKVSLAVWLTKLEQAPSLATIQNSITDPTVAAQVANIVASLPPNAGAGAVHQVATKSGIVYVPAKNNEASKALALLMNSLINADQLSPTFAQPKTPEDDDPLEEEGEDGDTAEGDEAEGEEEAEPTPPTAPSNLKAEQDSAGSIVLVWDAANGNPNGEAVSYDVERLDANSTDGGELETVTETRWKDQEEIKYPQEYTYRVYAKDDEDNASEAAIVTFTTTPLVTNVPGPAADAATPQGGEESGSQNQAAAPPTVITNPNNGAVSVNMPAGAVSQPAACAVGEANGDDSSLEGLGEIVVSPQEVACRAQNGDEIEEFETEVETDVEIDEEEIDGDDELDLYAFDGTDWVEVPTSDDEDGEERPEDSTADYTSAKLVKGEKGKKKAKYTVKSKKPTKLAVMKKKQEKGGFNPIFVIPPIILLGSGVAFILYRKQLIFSSAKSYPNGDVDLMLTPRAPEITPVAPGQPEEIIAMPTAELPQTEPLPDIEPPATPQETPLAPVEADIPEVSPEPEVAPIEAKEPVAFAQPVEANLIQPVPSESAPQPLQEVPVDEVTESQKLLTVDDLPTDYSGLEPEQIVRPTKTPKDGGGASS